jgi:hypothetical protein
MRIKKKSTKEKTSMTIILDKELREDYRKVLELRDNSANKDVAQYIRRIVSKYKRDGLI